ncbi:hypothetical protein RFI_33636, partial [Reticulomyxa filosa]
IITNNEDGLDVIPQVIETKNNSPLQQHQLLDMPMALTTSLVSLEDDIAMKEARKIAYEETTVCKVETEPNHVCMSDKDYVVMKMERNESNEDKTPSKVEALVEENLDGTKRNEEHGDMHTESMLEKKKNEKVISPMELKWIEKIHGWCAPKLKEWQSSYQVPMEVIVVIWLRLMYDLQQQNAKEELHNHASMEAMLEFLRPNLDEILEQYLKMYLQHNQKDKSTPVS